MKLRKTGKSIFIVLYYLLFLYIISKFLCTLFNRQKCRHAPLRHIHQPLSLLYPQKAASKSNMKENPVVKDKICIVMIIESTQDSIIQARDHLENLTHILAHEKRSIKAVVGVTGLNDDLTKEFVQNKLQNQRMRVDDIEVFSLSSKDLELFTNSMEYNLITRQKFDQSFILERAKINILISLALMKCSRISRFCFFTDAFRCHNEGLSRNLLQAFEIFEKNNSLSFIRLGENDFNKVYRVDYNLDLFINLLFRTSLQLSFLSTSNQFDFMMSTRTKVHLKQPILMPNSMPCTKLKKNPKAFVTTNVQIYRENFPHCPYEFDGILWSSFARKNSFVMFKFIEPIAIKHILIETGKDIYLTDFITSAVLEETIYKENQGIQDCGHFKVISDFRAGGINLDLSKRRQQKTLCLRVRFVKDIQWVAIRNIKITT